MTNNGHINKSLYTKAGWLTASAMHSGHEHEQRGVKFQYHTRSYNYAGFYCVYRKGKLIAKFKHITHARKCYKSFVHKPMGKLFTCVL